MRFEYAIRHTMNTKGDTAAVELAERLNNMKHSDAVEAVAALKKTKPAPFFLSDEKF